MTGCSDRWMSAFGYGLIEIAFGLEVSTLADEQCKRLMALLDRCWHDPGLQCEVQRILSSADFSDTQQKAMALLSLIQ